jgi:hypothetical protein
MPTVNLMPRKKKIASKTTAKKPTAKKPQSKTKFILGQPKTLAAKEVVAKGKAAGVTFTEKYVWQVRSAKKVAKKKSKVAVKATPKPTKSSRPTGRKPGPKTTFVLAQDPKLSAAEVVKLAQAAGHTLTARRVHNIRWKAKQKGTPKAAVQAAPVPKAGKPTKVASPKAKLAPAKAAKPAKPATKTAFVLGFPQGTSAADVVAAAEAKGITLTTAHVYAIRTSAKAKAKNKGKAAKTPKAPAVKTVAQPAFRAAPRTGSLEEHFVALVLDIGLARASDLLGKLKDRVRQLAL